MGGRLLAISLLKEARGFFKVDRISVVDKWAI